MKYQRVMSDFPTEVDGPPLTCGFIVADYETLHIAPAANVNKRCKTVVRGRTIKRALVPGKMVDAMKRRARQRHGRQRV